MVKESIQLDKKIKWRKYVDASLEHGRIFTKSFIGWIYVFLGFAILVTILLIALAIYYSELNYLYGLVLICIVIPCLVFIVFYHNKLIRTIIPFIDDAVELSAEAIEVGCSSQVESLVVPTIRKKISIKFVYNGTKIIRLSGKKGYDKPYLYNSKAGYEKIFTKYANRKIQIFYSPKYDQVLILKDNKVRTK